MNKLMVYIISMTVSFCALAQQDFKTPADQRVIKVIGRADFNELDGSSISLLCWNIHKAGDELFSPVFRNLSGAKDLVLVQEAFIKSNGQNSYIDTNLGQWTFAQSFSYSFSGDMTGVATVSRATPTRVQFIRSTALEPVTFTPKMSLITWFKIKGLSAQLMVINVHGINFVVDGDFRKEMKRIQIEIAKHQGPLILAGDFNTWDTLRQQILQKLANDVGAREVTFSPENRKVFMGQFVDHIFYRGLALRRSNAVNTVRASDHNALVAEFSAVASY